MVASTTPYIQRWQSRNGCNDIYANKFYNQFICSHFLTATFDFTIFFTQTFYDRTIFYSLAVFVWILITDYNFIDDLQWLKFVLLLLFCFMYSATEVTFSLLVMGIDNSIYGYLLWLRWRGKTEWYVLCFCN